MRQTREREKPFKEQAEDMPIAGGTLQYHLSKEKDAHRFVQTRAKYLDRLHRASRVPYAEEHKYHTLENFWSFVRWTDEAHFNSEELAHSKKLILRKRGTSERLILRISRTRSQSSPPLFIAQYQSPGTERVL